MLQKIVGSKSKTFLAFCFSFLAGVALASFFPERLPWVYGYFFAFVSVAGIIIFWSNPVVRFISLVLLFCTVGVYRYELAFPVDNAQDITHYFGEERTFAATIADEPDVRTDGVRYIIEVKSQKSKVKSQTVNGRVYLKTDLYPRYQYGDVLQIRCRLEEPTPIVSKQTGNTFYYDKYLATRGVFTTCQKPKLEFIGSSGGHWFYRNIFAFKNKIAEQIQKLWGEPAASFMAGILYGYRGGLVAYTALFARAGISHIMAVSGYNMSILVTTLMTVFAYALIPRQRAFWIIMVGLIFFIIFSGASGSVVRAGLMAALILIARQLGRLAQIGNTLILAAALIVLHNPFVLVWDIGFQLSFLATLGLVYLSPLIANYLTPVPELFGFKQVVISTFAAIIATLPLILYQFGQISLVAPLVNVLVLWLIPWLMLGGTVSIILSFIFLPLAQLMAYVPDAGMRYIFAVAEWFAGLPLAAVNVTIPWFIMIGLYMGIIVIYRTQRKRMKVIV